MSSPPVRVEELTTSTAFRALAHPWSSIAQRNGQRGPFFQPGWLAITARALESPPRQPFVLAAHRAGQPLALLPLLRERRTIGSIPLQVYRSLSDDHSQRFDLVAAENPAIDALAHHLAADRRWNVLELRDLPPAAAAEQIVAWFEQRGWPIGSWPSQRSPYLRLPVSHAEFVAHQPAKFRANLRRRRRSLIEQEGPIALERITGGRLLDRALEDGFALEAAGWKGRLGTAIAGDPKRRARYRAIAHWAAHRRELSLHFLRVGERRVGFHFALEVEGCYYLFKPAYEERLARFGIGHLMMDEVVQSLIARRLHTVDLLGDRMEWKQPWTTDEQAHRWVHIFRPTPIGKALAAWKYQLVPWVGALWRRVAA